MANQCMIPPWNVICLWQADDCINRTCQHLGKEQWPTVVPKSPLASTNQRSSYLQQPIRRWWCARIESMWIRWAATLPKPKFSSTRLDQGLQAQAIKSRAEGSSIQWLSARVQQAYFSTQGESRSLLAIACYIIPNSSPLHWEPFLVFKYGIYKLMINVDSIIIKILIHGLSVANFIVLFFPLQLAGTRCQREEDREGLPPGVELTAVVKTGGDD